jgi:hypothetical protein
MSVIPNNKQLYDMFREPNMSQTEFDNRVRFLMKNLENNNTDIIDRLTDSKACNKLMELKILDFLKTHGFISRTPERHHADKVSANGHLDVLIFLEQAHKIVPTKKGATEAAVNKYLNILDWLYERNIIPDVKCCIRVTDVRVLHWFEAKGLKFWGTNVEAANSAAEQGFITVLDWLEQRQDKILPTVEGADRAANDTRMASLEWLSKRGILPTVEMVDSLAETCNWLWVFDWFYVRNIIPTSFGAYLAKKNGNEVVVKWCEDRNIFPYEKNECLFD